MKVCEVPWTKKRVFVHVFLQVFFSGGFGGLNLDIWERKNKHLVEGYREKHLSQKLYSLVLCFCFFVFMILGSLGFSFQYLLLGNWFEV